MAMNEIDIILKKNPSINKEDLLILASWYWMTMDYQKKSFGKTLKHLLIS